MSYVGYIGGILLLAILLYVVWRRLTRPAKQAARLEDGLPNGTATILKVPPPPFKQGTITTEVSPVFGSVVPVILGKTVDSLQYEDLRRESFTAVCARLNITAQLDANVWVLTLPWGIFASKTRTEIKTMARLEYWRRQGLLAFVEQVGYTLTHKGLTHLVNDHYTLDAHTDTPLNPWAVGDMLNDSDYHCQQLVAGLIQPGETPAQALHHLAHLFRDSAALAPYLAHPETLAAAATFLSNSTAPVQGDEQATLAWLGLTWPPGTHVVRLMASTVLPHYPHPLPPLVVVVPCDLVLDGNIPANWHVVQLPRVAK